MAKGKVLSTSISFGGKVDPSLGKALKASQSKAAKAAEKISKSMSTSTKAASKAMGASIKSMATGALKVYGVLKAIGKLKDYAGDSITAAKAQLEVQTKLSSVLENVKSIQIRGPNAAANAAKELNKVADALEAVGVIGNDVTVAGMQQLATYQLSDKQISVLSVGMDDLLAQQKGLNATQSDAVSIGNMIGKAMTGSVGALSKVGISFTKAQAEAIKTGDATQRAATIAEVLKDNVGGVNKAMAQTDSGQLVQAQNTFDAIKEEIGYFLLPLMNQFVKGVLPYVQQGLNGLTGILNKISPIISGGISAGFKYMSDIMPILSKGISDLLPFIVQIMKPLNMGKELLPIIIAAIKNLLPSIVNVVKVIAPLIPKLIGALIPALEKIVPIFANIINKILPVLASLISNLMPIITDILSQVIPLVGSIIAGLIPAIEGLISPISMIIKSILPVFISLVKMIAPIWTNLISQAIQTDRILISALIPAIKMLFPPIMNLIQSLLPVLHKFFSAIYNLIQALAPVISVIAQLFSVVLSAAIVTLTPIIQGIITHFTNIINILTNIINFIVNVFTGNWSAAWENIKNVFAGIFNGFIDIAKAPLNAVISLVNSAISGINGLIGVINKIPGVEIGKIPQIPYLAKGATVTSPTLAMIGEGKVPETVVPHNNTPRSRALLYEAAKGVGVTNDRLGYLPVVDRISKSLSYFEDNISRKIRTRSNVGNTTTINNSKSERPIQITYAPVINAKNTGEIKDMLDDEFEKFQKYMEEWLYIQEREVFA